MQRKKIGDASQYIIPLGLLGLAGWVVYKYFISGTATGTGANNATQAANVASAAAAQYQASAANTPQAVPDATLNSMIGTMLSDAEQNTSMFSGSGPGDDIVTTMGQLQNITDLYRLMQLWGTRNAAGASGSICDLIDIDCTAVDLGTFIHATLSASQIVDLNQLIQANGINYTFS